MRGGWARFVMTSVPFTAEVNSTTGALSVWSVLVTGGDIFLLVFNLNLARLGADSAMAWREDKQEVTLVLPSSVMTQ